MYNSVSSLGRTRDMANTEENESLRDLEGGSGQAPAANPPAPPNILKQASLGNLDLFRTELESGDFPLDFTAERGQYFNRTPLHMAALEGHDEIVEFILSHPQISKEVVNAKDYFGYTPLHLAVRHSHIKVVELLTTSSLVLPDRFLPVTREPDDVGEHSGGCTPLHLAAVRGDLDIAILLVRQPCQEGDDYDPVNICAMTWRNSTPLDLARKNRFWWILDFLEASDSNWLQQERAMAAASANAVLVGAALVAAAAFGAWLQTPGSMPSPDSGAPSPSPSASSLSARNYRNANLGFHLLVTFAFSFSVVSLVLGILATFSNLKESSKVNLRMLRARIDIARSCLLGGLAFLCIAVWVATTLVFDNVESRYKYVKVMLTWIPFIAYLFVSICYWYTL